MIALCTTAALFLHGTNAAAEGTFDTLTYNINGIPLFSDSETERQEATEIISCYVNDYDIVNVQEDFNYHAALYDTCNSHAYRTPTTGGVAFGSGLNTLSHFPFEPVERVRWADCSGIDCFTPKGFTIAQVRVAEGVYVDVYNMHSQAGSSDDELEKRRANTREMLNAAESRSSGNAVILMGDTNTRYTRCGDVIGEALDAGFSDPWIELVRGGQTPTFCTDSLVCDEWSTSADCEIVDKVIYRGNNFITLTPTQYAVRLDAVDDAGLGLSDHPPVSVNWHYATDANVSATDTVGGNGGTAFNSVNSIAGAGASRISTLTVRGGSRVDAISFTLENGASHYYGGSGGSDASIALEDGEYIAHADVCVGTTSTDRIFYAAFTTAGGSITRTVARGTTTDRCVAWDAPSGFAIEGFQGRVADEVDRIGVIFAKL